MLRLFCAKKKLFSQVNRFIKPQECSIQYNTVPHFQWTNVFRPPAASQGQTPRRPEAESSEEESSSEAADEESEDSSANDEEAAGYFPEEEEASPEDAEAGEDEYWKFVQISEQHQRDLKASKKNKGPGAWRRSSYPACWSCHQKSSVALLHR